MPDVSILNWMVFDVERKKWKEIDTEFSIESFGECYQMVNGQKVPMEMDQTPTKIDLANDGNGESKCAKYLPIILGSVLSGTFSITASLGAVYLRDYYLAPKT